VHFLHGIRIYYWLTLWFVVYFQMWHVSQNKDVSRVREMLSDTWNIQHQILLHVGWEWCSVMKIGISGSHTLENHCTWDIIIFLSNNLKELKINLDHFYYKICPIAWLEFGGTSLNQYVSMSCLGLK
jgi:hypothetical protein